MELNISKMVDKMTRGSYIPTGSSKSEDDDSNFVHYTGTATYVDLDKTNLLYLVG